MSPNVQIFIAIRNWIYKQNLMLRKQWRREDVVRKYPWLRKLVSGLKCLSAPPPPPKSLLHTIGKFSVPWFWSCINLFLLEGVYINGGLRSQELPPTGNWGSIKHGMSLSLSLINKLSTNRARDALMLIRMYLHVAFTHTRQVWGGGGYANNGTLFTLISPQHRDSFLLYNLCYYFYMTLHCTLLYCQNDTMWGTNYYVN